MREELLMNINGNIVCYEECNHIEAKNSKRVMIFYVNGHIYKYFRLKLTDDILIL